MSLGWATLVGAGEGIFILYTVPLLGLVSDGRIHRSGIKMSGPSCSKRR